MSDATSSMLTGLAQHEFAGTPTATSISILREILSATNEIRDHLAGKKAQRDIQSIIESLPDDVLDPRREETNAKPGSNANQVHIPAVSTSRVCEEVCGWMNASKIRERCTQHRIKCISTREALRCFIAHLTFIGGNEENIEKAQRVMGKMLDPIEHLQSSLTGRNTEKMREVKDSLSTLGKLIKDFYFILDQKYEGSFLTVWRWRRILFNGWDRTWDLINENKYTESFEYIVNTLFPESEAAMDAVCKELATFEEKSASDWLAKQKYEGLKRRCKDYVDDVFRTSSINSSDSPRTLLQSEKTPQWKKNHPKRKLVWEKMCDEIGHLIGHYTVVGGDKTVIEAATSVRKNLLRPINRLQKLLESSDGNGRADMSAMMDDLGSLWVSVTVLERCLYHQKHAFYFREVKQWVDCLWSGLFKIRDFIRRNELNACLDYMCTDLFPNLEKIMLGVTKPSDLLEVLRGDSKTLELTTANVAQELKTFGEKSLPTFLANEMERDTARFVNITAIATFFSSVTATTLQFTYQSLGNESSESLRGIVNLFWFLSLVFSVTSGVSSLLGLTWRKSSIHDSHKPPKLIRMWFDKAPMIFLIVAAVAFVIGLNLFSYLSAQPHYVSIATNVFTALLGICLMCVTSWFIYQLKYESFWKLVDWVWSRRILQWISYKLRWFRHPRREYRKKVHFKRNIYWAFGFDGRVAQLNFDIDWNRGWPGPYLLSRIVRRIVYPIKKFWAGLSKALSFIVHSIKTSAHALFHLRDEEINVEAGERKLEEAKSPDLEETIDDRARKTKSVYRATLNRIFGEVTLVESVMMDIERWQNGSWTEEFAELYIKRKLWGYPDLVRKLREDVRPVLIEAREKAEIETANKGLVGDAHAEQLGVQISESNANSPSLTLSSLIIRNDKGKGRIQKPSKVTGFDSTPERCTCEGTSSGY